MSRSSLAFIGATFLFFAGIGNSFASDAAANDEAITKQVNAVFSQHADLGTQWHVQTIKGIVYIHGIVANSLAKANADSLAKTVSGVKDVVDDAGVDK